MAGRFGFCGRKSSVFSEYKGYMKEDFEHGIKEILGGLQCPKGVKCYKNGFKDLCKAEDIGCETFIKCLEEKPHNCTFALPFGYSWHCTCPLRIYVIKKLGSENKKSGK
jgi:hypothetical protein